MDTVFNIAIILLIVSFALRSFARTYAYLCLAKREKEQVLKDKLLKR